MADDLNSITEMSDDVLFCKASVKHDMRITALREGVRADEVDWICQMCGRVRHDTYDPNGHLVNRWYEALPGSKVSGCETADYKKELFRRFKGGGMQVARATRRRRSS